MAKTELPRGYTTGMSGGIHDNVVAMRRLMLEFGWQEQGARPVSGEIEIHLLDPDGETITARAPTFQVAARRVVATLQAKLLKKGDPALAWLLEKKVTLEKKEP